MSEVDSLCHQGEMMYRGLVPLWETRGTTTCCSYCGSLSVPDAIRLLSTPGAEFSGSDKTFYKAYIGEGKGGGKFYFRHLRASDDAELAAFNTLSRKVLGLSWTRPKGAEGKKGELASYCPKSTSFYRWQTYGVIGPDGEPVFKDGAPLPPPPEWWAKMDAAT